MEERVVVVGLGYVGLPLACYLSKHYSVIGYDVDVERIEELKIGRDKTLEFNIDELKEYNIEYTSDSEKIKESKIFILAIPTPVTSNNTPDLTALENATRTIGKNLKKGDLVIYESTVAPGTTEELCKTILEETSGLKCETDFGLGYSPERVNPGDKEHRHQNVVKVVSGIDSDSLNKVVEIYSKISKEIYRAPSIKVAEASKLVENIQRDVNIALMNELSTVFNKLEINTKEVLETAGTKWNFLHFYPGLVGGHCICVDPYYLIDKSEKEGIETKLIKQSREINESKIKELGERLEEYNSILFLGLTFKENVPDLRNSKILKVISNLKQKGKTIYAFDPLLNPEKIKLLSITPYIIQQPEPIDCLVLVNASQEFQHITLGQVKTFFGESDPVIFDLKNYYDKKEVLKMGIEYKNL